MPWCGMVRQGWSFGGWLGEPHVAGVAGELAAFEGPDDRVAIADLAARGVHEIGAALHLGEQLVVEEVLRFRMKRRIDRHNVTDLDHVLDIRMPGEVEFLLDRLRQPVPIVVMQMHVEGLEPAKHGEADAAGGDRADVHALDIIGARDAVGDVPAALHHPLVGGNVVPHEPEDHHHDVFGDADRIAVGDLGDRDPAVDRGLKVDVVGADAGGDGELQLLGLGDPIGRQIGRPEGLRDHDIRVRKLALKH